jgi:putative ABC transport system permease protein
MNTFAKIAYRNVAKNWRHSLAAVISISAGFISLVLFQGYIVDVEEMYRVSFRNRAMYGDLIVEDPRLHTQVGRIDPEKFYITQERQDKLDSFLLKQKEQVVTRVRFLPMSGLVTNGKNSFIFMGMGYDIAEGLKMRGQNWGWNAVYGEPLDQQKEPLGLLVGKSLGLLLGCEPGQLEKPLVQNNGYKAEVRPFKCGRSQLQLSATTETGQLNAIDLNIVGMVDGGYREVDERYLSTSLPNAQSLLNTKSVRFATLLLNDSADVTNFKNLINRFFIDNQMPERAINWLDHQVADIYLKIMSLLAIFKVFIVIVIMVISGLSVFNTMVKIVKERTKEIGTLRSIGYTGQQVGSIFSFEALFLSLLGIFIGIITSLIFTLWINHAGIIYKAGMLSEPVIFKIAIDPLSYIQSLGLLVILAVVTSWIATRDIVRSRVAENLTYA